MLVLKRNLGGVIRIGDNITVKVKEITPTSVTLLFNAPKEITIDREEVYESKKERAAKARPASGTEGRGVQL